MIWFISLVIVSVIGWFAWKSKAATPTEKVKEGAKQAVTEAKEVVVHVTEKAKKVADVNNDGKVDLQDVVAAAENVKKEVGRQKRKYGGRVKKEKK
jgi:hypothetical protein